MIRRMLTLAACATALLLTAPLSAQADTFLVDDAGTGSAGTCDTGTPADCTLRDAIDAANANSGADQIDFLPLAIELDDPLPAVTDPVAVDAFGVAVTVSGSAAYATSYCAGSEYAFDLTAPNAAPSSVRALPVFAVCGRAINSNVPAPTIQVGPRRFDNTVSISGQAAPSATVDIFSADGPSTMNAEGDDYLVSPAVPSGSYSYMPGVEPVAGSKFTALQLNGSGGSNFSATAVTPSDLTSPTLLRAVAISNTAVRFDFSEPIAAASAQATAFSLSVAGAPRAIASSTVQGASVFVESSNPWLTGEAGSASLTGAARVTDQLGNEVLGQPSAAVAAGPGEAVLPLITSMRASPNRVCKKVTSRCRRGSISVLIALNKPGRVIFEVRRRGKSARTMVTFVRRLNAGRNRVKLTSIVSGKQLPRAVLILQARAQDVARSMSAPVETNFRIVDDKRDL